jgi:hypothetical protein
VNGWDGDPELPASKTKQTTETRVSRANDNLSRNTRSTASSKPPLFQDPPSLAVNKEK